MKVRFYVYLHFAVCLFTTIHQLPFTTVQFNTYQYASSFIEECR